MKKITRITRGFTLVEIIVVITILATLIVISLVYIDPVTQLNKFTDSKRKEDILQIKTALDTYYNDNNCYPTSIPYGGGWSENGAIYMKKVPQDPDCGDSPTTCYANISTTDCPQWTVVFAKLSKAPLVSACPLSSLSSCVPQGYDSSWACVVAGSADCSYISTIDLAATAASTSGYATPTPTSPVLPQDTPTPTPNICSPKNYACAGNPSVCNVVPAGTGTFCTPNCDGAC